jgi:transmembrane 9 superfamily protein 3
VVVKDGALLRFSYSVHWSPVSIPFSRRFERYLDYTFFEHKVRWWGGGVMGSSHA